MERCIKALKAACTPSVSRSLLLRHESGEYSAVLHRDSLFHIFEGALENLEELLKSTDEITAGAQTSIGASVIVDI